MNEIVLKMASTSEAEQQVLLLLRNGFKPFEATITYSLKEKPSVKLSKVKDFPLLLTGNLNNHVIRVAVSPLAIGSHCEGAYALRKILKASGFHFEERDLFTTRRFNINTGRLKLVFTRK